jgi:hypothetical protein
VLADRRLQVEQVLRVERVRLMVREVAVELEVERLDVQRQAAQDRRDGVPAHAVAGVDDDLQRADAAQVDELTQVGAVLGEQVGAGDLPRAPLGGRHLAAVQDLLGDPADIGQTRILPDRRRAGTAQLDPVVLRGVVACGEHRAGQLKLAGGEVQHVGGAETGLHNVHTLADDALGEGPRQRHGRLTHVVGRDDLRGTLRRHEPGERHPDRADDRRVQLVRDHPTDVIRLDDARQVWHGWIGSSRIGTLTFRAYRAGELAPVPRAALPEVSTPSLRQPGEGRTRR